MSATGAELRGWHVLGAMLAFFGIIIAVNAAFIVFAVQSFPGEDVRRSYLQGLQYNQTLAERRTQATLGWEASAALRPGPGGAILEVVLRDRAGAPLTDIDLSGNLQWPTNAGLDREIAFEATGAGHYTATLGDLAAGRWRLRAHAQRGDGSLDLESDLTWPSR